MPEPDEYAELIPDFLIESQENLNRLDEDFVALEKAPSDQERLASIFRTIHTIKGTCGYLNFSKLGALTHAGETLLGRLRDGALHLNAEMTNALLEMVDAVRAMLRSIEKSRNEGDGDYLPLIEKLLRLDSGLPAGKNQPVIESPASTPAAPAANAGEQTSDSMVSQSTLRVQVELLDRLMNLTGELVLARNQLLKRATGETGTALAATLQQLNLVTTDLQEAVMKTRMQRMGHLWQMLPRMVRDLALGCGKKVRLEMSGQDVELDKTLLEAVKDPLVHAVRNAVDHGIETPDRRVACGKPAEGLISLRARHEAGYVIIEMTDDGAGLNLEKIKQKGLDQGLITPEAAARSKDRDIIQLIFAPGFSTADHVTGVSGRGVGMDVVKTNIEMIGGTVDLESQPGGGVTLKMRIPLTLAIIPALIVTCRGDRFAVPQINLLELLRLEGDAAVKAIENLYGAPVYRLRGRLLPLVYFHSILNPASGPADPGQTVNIVVLKIQDLTFGLVVDGVHGTEEIVVKPLVRLLKGVASFAGATIMGDGKVALILDVKGLAQRANLFRQEDQAHRLVEDEALPLVLENWQTMLLFQTSRHPRMGIPIGQVERLEQISSASIERSNQQDAVQYRGQIMPLVYLSQFLGGAPEEEKKEMRPVVVCAREGRFIGLVVDRILDIVVDTVTIQRETGKAGVLGSAVIAGKITDLLDVNGIVQSMHLEPSAQSLGKAA